MKFHRASILGVAKLNGFWPQPMFIHALVVSPFPGPCQWVGFFLVSLSGSHDWVHNKMGDSESEFLTITWTWQAAKETEGMGA